MNDTPPKSTCCRAVLATVLFPPLGWIFVWRSKRGLLIKLLGTGGVLLGCFIYTALVVWLLIRSGAVEVEWRGGYLPALTFAKTQPDYAALAKSRAAQNRPLPGLPTRTNTSTYWTGFRGPNRDGHYAEMPIRTDWPSGGLKPLWKQPCGGGYASFAIAEGLAFTIEQRQEQETAVAYDVATGREVWTDSWPAQFNESMGGEGPRATPAYAAGKVFVLGAMGELRCFEARTGQRLWARNILTENGAPKPRYGIAASPLLVEDKLIVLASRARDGSVLCLDPRGGRQLWAALREPMGYASPMLATFGGERQVIVCAETNTVGLRLEDGAVRWSIPWRVQQGPPPIAQPVLFDTNRFMLSAGYFTGCAGVEVTRTEAGFAARELWRNKNLRNKFTSSVLHEGCIYGLDEDNLVCLDAATGARKWKGGRYGYGQVVLASGCLVVLCGDGQLALVRATPARHEELARFPALRGKTWNHPALAGGWLLVRNAAEMACFEIAR